MIALASELVTYPRSFASSTIFARRRSRTGRSRPLPFTFFRFAMIRSAATWDNVVVNRGSRSHNPSQRQSQDLLPPPMFKLRGFHHRRRPAPDRSGKRRQWLNRPGSSIILRAERAYALCKPTAGARSRGWRAPNAASPLAPVGRSAHRNQ